MIVTRIVSVTKTKFKVYIDEQFAFVLYKGELSRYQIQEGKELSQDKIDEIQSEVVLKRAKLRAMHLLNDMDRTEEQLRLKLKQGLYTEDVIDKALQYVKSFGYINDDEYAARYIMSRQSTKSKREIYASLCQKGVDRERIERAMETCYESTNELETIHKLMKKKSFCPENSTLAQKKKMYDYFMRKGFRSEDVRQVIQVSSWNA